MLLKKVSNRTYRLLMNRSEYSKLNSLLKLSYIEKPTTNFEALESFYKWFNSIFKSRSGFNRYDEKLNKEINIEELVSFIEENMIYYKDNINSIRNYISKYNKYLNDFSKLVNSDQYDGQPVQHYYEGEPYFSIQSYLCYNKFGYFPEPTSDKVKKNVISGKSKELFDFIENFNSYLTQIISNLCNKGELPDANEFTYNLIGEKDYKKLLPLTIGNRFKDFSSTKLTYEKFLNKVGNNYKTFCNLENYNERTIFSYLFTEYDSSFDDLLDFNISPSQIIGMLSDLGKDHISLDDYFILVDDIIKMISPNKKLGQRLDNAAEVAKQNPQIPENKDYLIFFYKLRKLKFGLMDYRSLKSLHDQAVNYVSHIKKYTRVLLGESSSQYGSPIVPDSPPIIIFLKNDEELEEEGAVMNHCSGSYTEDCKRGKSFIYHYDDGTNIGTFELNQNRDIVQFYGRGNSEMPEKCWDNLRNWLKGEKIKNWDEIELEEQNKNKEELVTAKLKIIKSRVV